MKRSWLKRKTPLKGSSSLARRLGIPKIGEPKKRKPMRQVQNKHKLKKELWDLMSQFVRRSAASPAGFARCYTCGALKKWKRLQAGHFVNKSHGLAAYFTLENIRVQCVRCNIFLEGNKGEYAMRLIREHGLEYVERLERLKVEVMKIDYPSMIRIYKHKLSTLPDRQ